MECGICGKEEALPFKCAYCGGTFCSDHRLPENHSCPEIRLANPPTTRWSRTRREKYKTRYIPVRRGFKPSFPPGSTETRHLALSSALVLLVGLSVAGWRGSPAFLLGVAVIFLASFLLHEFAHKLTALRNGLWAEFRIEPYGALLTAISILTPLKIIAPGAVLVVGSAGIDLIGRVAASGPLSNLTLIGVLYLSYLALPPGLFEAAALIRYGIYVNSIIAVFNLIPFSALDGRKIMAWSSRIWALLFAISLAIFIASISGIIP